MSDFECKDSNNSPTWGVTDLFIWKVVPERKGGGIGYIQGFKDAWVRHNKMYIITAATQSQIPKELLAGVCWIENGGDPNFIDGVAFDVRAFDWSGPQWMDNRQQPDNYQPTSQNFVWIS